MQTDRIPEDVRTEVIRRLRRAEGQTRAVARALEEGGDCRQVLRQLSAAKSALERAGVRLLAAGLIECLTEEQDGDLAQGDFEKLFLELA